VKVDRIYTSGHGRRKGSGTAKKGTSSGPLSSSFYGMRTKIAVFGSSTKREERMSSSVPFD